MSSSGPTLSPSLAIQRARTWLAGAGISNSEAAFYENCPSFPRTASSCQLIPVQLVQDLVAENTRLLEFIDELTMQYPGAASVVASSEWEEVEPMQQLPSNQKHRHERKPAVEPTFNPPISKVEGYLLLRAPPECPWPLGLYRERWDTFAARIDNVKLDGTLKSSFYQRSVSSESLAWMLWTKQKLLFPIPVFI